jgi:opacity protein-like surface antigen
MVPAMKKRLSLALGGALALSSSAAFAQAVQAQGTAGFPPAGPQYQPAPAYYPPPKTIENIGRTGQFIFGVERITGIFLDRQTITYRDPSSGTKEDFKYNATSFGLLGVDSNSPAALPRFALDYVAYQGITVGASLMLSTRDLSSSGDKTAQTPVAPPSASPDGLTLLGGVRVGYAYAFDSTWGIWGRAGLSYTSSSAESAFVDPTTGVVYGPFLRKTHFTDVNLDLLATLSPIEHIVLTGGPYVDIGAEGGYSVSQAGREIDTRDAHLTSFGILINAAGYY